MGKISFCVLNLFSLALDIVQVQNSQELRIIKDETQK